MSETSLVILNGNRKIERSRFKITPLGLKIDGNPTFDEWCVFGERLQQYDGAIQWAIGDWLNEGESRYGETYTQAIEALNGRYQALADYKWVSSHIDFSYRNEKVSWTHHRQIAKFPPAEQKRWLHQAEKEGWSVSELRGAIKEKAHSEVLEKINDVLQMPLKKVCDLRVCSCAELLSSGIRPDAVITDPPYSREFLSVFSELAESCKMANVPLVAVMSGQSYLPEVISRLCEHLTYRWTISYLTPGGQAVQQWQAKVNTFWKPVFLFGDSIDWLGDVCKSDVNDNDKRFHHWGQSESGMADLIGRLTQPGQLICDPFVGGGTTAIVSLALGRRFVGCDIDQSVIETATHRIKREHARGKERTNGLA